MLYGFLYIAFDAFCLMTIMWIFGASPFTQLHSMVEASIMTAILLREAVTISRIPDPPRMEGNKKTGEQ